MSHSKRRIESSPEPTFGVDDLIEALTSSQQHESGEGVTSMELAERLGTSQGRASELLRILYREGRIEVARGRRRNVMGVMQIVPIYRSKGASCGA